MTLEELQARYNQLTEEELTIPAKIDEILEAIAPLKERITSLEKQARDEDLRISEKPAQVYEKQCQSAFLGIGKTCQEIPVPNPDVAREIDTRNALIRERNTLLDQISAQFGQVAELTQRQVELEQQEVNIRNQIIDIQQKIAQEPVNILQTLGKGIKTLFFKEQFQEAQPAEPVAEPVEEKPGLIRFLPYIAIAGGVFLLLFLVKKKEAKKT